MYFWIWVCEIVSMSICILKILQFTWQKKKKDITIYKQGAIFPLILSVFVSFLFSFGVDFICFYILFFRRSFSSSKIFRYQAISSQGESMIKCYQNSKSILMVPNVYANVRTNQNKQREKKCNVTMNEVFQYLQTSSWLFRKDMHLI